MWTQTEILLNDEKAEMPFFLAEMHVMASDYQYNVYIRKERNKII